jgi:predicted ester cyclase
MRYLSVIVALLGISVALPHGRAIAQVETPLPPDCPIKTPIENTVIARAWHDDVINGRNPAILQDILAADVVHHGAGGYPKVMNATGITAMMGDFLTAFPDLRYTFDQFIVQDDYVVERYTAVGTQQGQFGDLPPSVPMVTVSNARTGATDINVAKTIPRTPRPNIRIIRMIVLRVSAIQRNQRQPPQYCIQTSNQIVMARRARTRDASMGHFRLARAGTACMRRRSGLRQWGRQRRALASEVKIKIETTFGPAVGSVTTKICAAGEVLRRHRSLGRSVRVEI